jgi:hypothetical protein
MRSSAGEVRWPADLFGAASAVPATAMLSAAATLAAAPVIAPVFSTDRRDTPVPSCFPGLSLAICPSTSVGV